MQRTVCFGPIQVIVTEIQFRERRARLHPACEMLCVNSNVTGYGWKHPEHEVWGKTPRRLQWQVIRGCSHRSGPESASWDNHTAPLQASVSARIRGYP